MLNILSILSFMLNNVESASPRFKIVDDEHIIDTHTGVELHMYNDWFKLTREDEVIATMPDFLAEEQKKVWELKQLITDPTKAVKSAKEATMQIKQRREMLSTLYENPQPIVDTSPVPEANTEIYKG